MKEINRRDYEIKDSKKIVSLIGGRGVGKTYLMFSKMNELFQEGIEKGRIIYLNFENPVLSEINPKEFRDILEVWGSIFPELQKKKIYLFIDEPQAIEKWELGVRDLYDNFNCHIFISGSSSKLLSKEIATSLRGRSIPKKIYPLSFKEFLGFKGQSFNYRRLSTKDKSKIKNIFDDYLENGGYPEIALENSQTEIDKTIKSYYDLIIYRDLIERYNIKNTSLVKFLINYFITSAPKQVNINKIFNSLKSKGIKLSKNTLYEYVGLLEDSFFIHFLEKHSNSIKGQDSPHPKVYLGDVSFMNLFSEKSYGKRLENVVLLNFLINFETKHSMRKISFWKFDGECDFLVQEKNKVIEAIQVCYDLNDENREREFKGLLEAMGKFGLNEGLILTYDQEEEIARDGKKIFVKPVWKWCLE